MRLVFHCARLRVLLNIIFLAFFWQSPLARLEGVGYYYSTAGR